MPERKIVAIHQPTFFPWLGYFDKIARADLFIVMDNVQFPKTAGTWSNRVRLIVNRRAAWVTMPIVRAYHGTRLICEMQINNATPWRTKVLKTIEMNYVRASFFKEVFPLLMRLVNNPTDSLADYNIAAIRALVSVLGINPSKLILGSTLDVKGKATDLLIAMTKEVGGTAYLCGGGAAGYQEDEKFAEAGIELIYQNFRHPEYPQINTAEFIPGLSIIDVLMNCGFENTQALLIHDREAVDRDVASSGTSSDA
ncbi:WbqC family protein [Candidatus Bipolaricaulota bacterium]|nr:WbqC family protein [Candidatus Bipolaricaulota bacterium]